MIRRWFCAMACLGLAGSALGQMDVGSDGSDGAFAPAANTIVDLALADSGPGTGHYDPDRWAVIFNYTSVDIPGGVTISFANHPSGAPVVWVVAGNVLIDGGVNLDGENHTGAAARPSIPGPGGFRGGRALLSAQSPGSGGYGPGGGPYDGTFGWNDVGHGGSYGTLGVGGPTTYGNEQIIPLIGGSGGSTHNQRPHQGGGAGGGAILIATNGTITVNGWIRSDGGIGNSHGGGSGSGSGSGGGIRLVATEVTGTGQALARGGATHRTGGKGRIRVEADTITFTHPGDPIFSFAPPDLDARCVGGTVDNSPCAGGDCGTGVCTADVPLLWPPIEAPILTATKLVVDAVDIPIPVDPESRLDFPDQDVSIDSENPVTLHIAATNVPLDWAVEVHLVAKSGIAERVLADPLAGTLASSATTATFTMPRGFSALQLRAQQPTP